MANAEIKEVKKNDKKGRESWFKRARAWLKRSWSELKKVTWPTFPEVVKNTGVVLLVVVCFTVVVCLFDTGLSALLNLLVG